MPICRCRRSGGATPHGSTFSGDAIINRDVTLTAAAGGTAIFSGQLDNRAGATITKSGAGTVRVNNLRGGGLIISAGTLQVTPDGTNSGTSQLDSLFVSGGTLDLTDNKLIVTGGDIGSWNGSAYTALTGLVQSGRGNGTWNGNGIVTSMTDATSGILTTQPKSPT